MSILVRHISLRNALKFFYPSTYGIMSLLLYMMIRYSKCLKECCHTEDLFCALLCCFYEIKEILEAIEYHFTDKSAADGPCGIYECLITILIGRFHGKKASVTSL